MNECLVFELLCSPSQELIIKVCALLFRKFQTQPLSCPLLNSINNGNKYMLLVRPPVSPLFCLSDDLLKTSMIITKKTEGMSLRSSLRIFFENSSIEQSTLRGSYEYLFVYRL